MKSFKFEYKREDIVSVIVIIIFLIILFLIDYFINTLNVNKKDIVLTSDTGEVYLTEYKYFWGGVWFNKDRLLVLDDNFKIEENSLISGSPTIIQLPFSKIKKVIFEEGYDIYEIRIESDGGFLNRVDNFYIRNKDNFEIVKDRIVEVNKGSFVIEETKTFPSRFSTIEEKRPIPKF